MPAGGRIDCRGSAGSGCKRQPAATLGGRGFRPIAIQGTVPVMATESPDSFVSVPISANPTEGPIRIEVRRKGRSVSIEWPASAASECALLLKEIMR